MSYIDGFVIAVPVALAWAALSYWLGREQERRVAASSSQMQTGSPMQTGSNGGT